MRPLGHGLDFCFSTRFSDCPDVEHWLLVTPVLTPLFSKQDQIAKVTLTQVTCRIEETKGNGSSGEQYITVPVEMLLH